MNQRFLRYMLCLFFSYAIYIHMFMSLLVIVLNGIRHARRVECSSVITWGMKVHLILIPYGLFDVARRFFFALSPF